MKQELIDQLLQITEEETELLHGNQDVKKELYTNKSKFEINSDKLIEKKKFINIRAHTRFVDFPPHTHNFIEIMYVCQGSITHIIDGNRICMKQGDLLFLNQHVRHAVEKAEVGDLGINFIALPEFFDIPLSMLQKDNVLAEFLIGTLRKDNVNPQYLHFQPRGNLAIDNLLEIIVDSILRGEEKEENLNQISMGLVFLHLLNHIDTLGKGSSQSYKDILVNTTLRYIDRNYKSGNLTTLAAELHQSLSSLSKLIKQTTGFTFQELLQRKKFQKAVELLIDTKLSIAEIMSIVGYENSSYFYRKFHEKYLMSPKEYRMKYKNTGKIRL